jgi:cytochrome b6-f complex iron-sulfur subunit
MSRNIQSDLNRRDFVTAAAAGIGILAGALGTPAALAQATTQPSTAGPLDVGAKSDYAMDGPVMTWAKDKHVIVLRETGKIYAMSSKCTHKGCVLDDASDHLTCPCHGSNFGYDGKVTDGPAKRSLVRYAITVNEDGHLIVDTSKTFSESKWDDAACYITVG